MKTKFFFTDIDGVWTDGSMYYDNIGNQFKRFNTYDSTGVIFLNKCNIITVIITGEKSKEVIFRAKKLGIQNVFIGVKDKLKLINSFCKKNNVEFKNQPYIGDDLNDIKCLENTKYSYCPSNAPFYIKKICKYNLTTKGGEGAFRDAVIHFLKNKKLFNNVIKKIDSTIYEQ